MPTPGNTPLRSALDALELYARWGEPMDRLRRLAVELPAADRPRYERLLDALEAERRRLAALAGEPVPTAREVLTPPEAWVGRRPEPEPLADDPEATRDVLLVTGVDVPLEVLALWAPADRLAAELWAGAVHAAASDNEGVEVPAPPAPLTPYLRPSLLP